MGKSKIKINADIIYEIDSKGYVIGKIDMTMRKIWGTFANYKTQKVWGK